VPQPQYLHILRRPRTARLLLPTLVGRIPDSIAGTAIVVLVRSQTGSYSLAGFAAGAFGIGTAVSAPFAGRALDRRGQRRVLPVLAAVFAIVLAAIALAGGYLGTAGTAVLAAAAGLARPPLEAALRAMWPRLVEPDRVDAAYALDSTVQELIWIGGPLLLALLLATGSKQFPLLACAAASAAGTIAYTAGLPAARPGRDAPSSSRAHSSPLRLARFRILLLAASCYGTAAGILNLAVVAFATAHGSTAWAGVLVAIWGGGSLAGGLAYGTRHWRFPVEARAMACLGLFAVALMVLTAAPSLPVLAVLMIPLGIPLSPWLGSLSASAQRAVPAASATEAFAWTFAVITVGQSAGNAVGGMIIQADGAAAFLAAGAFSLAGAAAGALWLLAHRGRLPSPEQALPHGKARVPKHQPKPPYAVTEAITTKCQGSLPGRTRRRHRRETASGHEMA
jgi:predicted MFS family arabinose efflux permease